MRRFTPIELAVGVSLLGCIASVAIPTFGRECHASRFSEPIDGLNRMGLNAVAYAEAHGSFPPSAPLTPTAPPRGKKEADPAGTWDHATWKALDFKPGTEGAPHAYAFSFDSTGATFVAKAHGDLDGDGIFSTFEIRGAMTPDKPHVEPGMYIENDLE